MYIVKNWNQNQGQAVHSIIHIMQIMELTQVSTDKSMDKENIVYTYNLILSTLKKERNHVDGPVRHCVD